MHPDAASSFANDPKALLSSSSRAEAAMLFEVEKLQVGFATESGFGNVVEDLSFILRAGETLALVGESGCGKSVTALSMMGLLDRKRSRVTAERFVFERQNLLELRPRGWRALRGNRIAMIFQEPTKSLNPAHTVGQQIEEALLAHRPLARGQARRRARELLAKVQIPDPDQRMKEYPHRLSGGTRQRVMIAIALACDPAVLIADEPTTALDVTVQAQILELLDTLRREANMALLLVTHDLGVVAERADRVAVMYAGRIVETAPTPVLFERPEHPYTVGLLASIPDLSERRRRLSTIPGQVPAPQDRGHGCDFAERCPFRIADCVARVPPFAEVGNAHWSACIRAPLDAASLGLGPPGGSADLGRA
ncbi:MAG: ABC transporter ATP-binding protein [Burkholderiaceae bacterium]|jgi:peptide/nickel transport system ATP-binding protein